MLYERSEAELEIGGMRGFRGWMDRKVGAGYVWCEYLAEDEIRDDK